MGIGRGSLLVGIHLAVTKPRSIQEPVQPQSIRDVAVKDQRSCIIVTVVATSSCCFVVPRD